MPLILKFNFTEAPGNSITLQLPLIKSGSPVGNISSLDWGQGGILTNAPDNPSKNYTITTTKTFTVTIGGDNLKLNNSSQLAVYSAYLTECNDLTNIIDLTAAFRNCTKLTTITGSISTLVTDMSYMFFNSTFTGDLNTWDVTNVTNMSSMFKNASGFNGNITGWKVGKVTNMSNMFDGASKFNQNINYNPTTNAWDVTNVIKMSSMFKNASKFNGNITGWKVGKVTDMSSMFYGATAFNGNINYNPTTNAWDVSQVIDMSEMFYGASAFNGNISAWDVSQVTDMSSMFQDATSFTGSTDGISYTNLKDWNVGKVIKMSSMFRNASAFSQDISAWDIGKVIYYTNFSTIRNGTITLDNSTYDYLSPITMRVQLLIPKFPISYNVTVKKDESTFKEITIGSSYSYTFIPFTSQLTSDYLTSVQLSIVLTVFGSTFVINSNPFTITPPVIPMNSSYDYFENITNTLNANPGVSFTFKLNSQEFGTGTLSNNIFSFNPYKKMVGPTLVGRSVTLSLIYSFITITTTPFIIAISSTLPISTPINYFNNTSVSLPIPDNSTNYSVSLKTVPLITTKLLNDTSSKIYTFNPYTNAVPDSFLGVNVYLSFSFNNNIVNSQFFQITPPSILMNPSYNYFADITASIIGSQAIPTTITLNTKTLIGTSSTGTQYTYTFNPFTINLVNYENIDFIIIFTFSNGIKVKSTPFKITPYVIPLFTVYDYFSKIRIDGLNSTPDQITALGPYSVELSYSIIEFKYMGTPEDTGKTAILSPKGINNFDTYSFNPFELLTGTLGQRSNILNSSIETKTNILGDYLNKSLTLSLVFNKLTLRSTPFTIVPYVVQLNPSYYSFSTITATFDPGFPVTSIVFQLKKQTILLSLTAEVVTIDTTKRCTFTPKDTTGIADYYDTPVSLSFTINSYALYSTPFTINTYKVQMEPSYHYFSTITANINLNESMIINMNNVRLYGIPPQSTVGVSILSFSHLVAMDFIKYRTIQFDPYDIPEFDYDDYDFYLSFVVSSMTIQSTKFKITRPVVTINNCNYFTDNIATFDVAPTHPYTVKLNEIYVPSPVDLPYLVDLPSSGDQYYTFNPYANLVISDYLSTTTTVNVQLFFNFDTKIIIQSNFFTITTPPFKLYPPVRNYFSGITAMFGFTTIRPCKVYYATTTTDLIEHVVLNLTGYTFEPYIKSTDTLFKFDTVSTLNFEFELNTTTITVSSEPFTIPLPTIVVGLSYDYFKDITVTLDTKSNVIRPTIKLTKNTSFPLEYTNNNDTYTFNPYAKSVTSDYLSTPVKLSFIFGKVTINSNEFTITTTPFEIYPPVRNYFLTITAIFRFTPIGNYMVYYDTTLLENVVSKLTCYTFDPYTKGLTTGNTTLSFVFSLTNNNTITVNSEPFNITTPPFKMNDSYDYFKEITVDLGFMPRQYTVRRNNIFMETVSSNFLYSYTFNPYTKGLTTGNTTLSFEFGTTTIYSEPFEIVASAFKMNDSYDYFKDITVELGFIPSQYTVSCNGTFMETITSNLSNYTFNPYTKGLTRGTTILSFNFGTITVVSESFTLTTSTFKMNDTYDYFTEITVEFGVTPRIPYQVKLPNKITYDTVATSNYTFNPYTNEMTNEYLNVPLTISFKFDNIIIQTTPFTITTRKINMEKTYSYFEDITTTLDFIPTSYKLRLYTSTYSISLTETMDSSYTFNPYISTFTSDFLNVPLRLYYIFDSIILQSTSFMIIAPTIQMNLFYDYDKNITATIGFIRPYTVRLYTSTQSILLPGSSNASYSFNPYTTSTFTKDYLNVPVMLYFIMDTIILKSTSFTININPNETEYIPS